MIPVSEFGSFSLVSFFAYRWMIDRGRSIFKSWKGVWGCQHPQPRNQHIFDDTRSPKDYRSTKPQEIIRYTWKSLIRSVRSYARQLSTIQRYFLEQTIPYRRPPPINQVLFSKKHESHDLQTWSTSPNWFLPTFYLIELPQLTTNPRTDLRTLQNALVHLYTTSPNRISLRKHLCLSIFHHQEQTPCFTSSPYRNGLFHSLSNIKHTISNRFDTSPRRPHDLITKNFGFNSFKGSYHMINGL